MPGFAEEPDALVGYSHHIATGGCHQLWPPVVVAPHPVRPVGTLLGLTAGQRPGHTWPGRAVHCARIKRAAAARAATSWRADDHASNLAVLSSLLQLPSITHPRKNRAGAPSFQCIPSLLYCSTTSLLRRLTSKSTLAVSKIVVFETAPG